MARRLEKTSLPAKKISGLPALDLRRIGLPSLSLENPQKGDLPNASLIYGIAAAGLVGISLFFLLTGLWVKGILILLPAGCLLGFALYFLRITK